MISGPEGGPTGASAPTKKWEANSLNSVHYSSQTDMWETPQWLFDKLNAEYHFTLDACAVPENAKCPMYFTPEQDGLSQDWTGRVWCNPPYGRKIGRWVRKAFECSANVVVMLLPARTDTKWFHDYINGGKGHVEFIRGRLHFSGSRDRAPFPSMIVVFDRRGKKTEKGGENMDQTAIEIVEEYIVEHLDCTDQEPEFEVYIVWKCKALKNWKYLISSSLPDGMYYEVTVNGENGEIYLDAYKKFENRVYRS